LVLWRFKVSLIKTKAVVELVTSPKQYPAFWLIQVHQSISDDLLSHRELDVNQSSRKILNAGFLLVLGSIASSVSLDFMYFLRLVLWKSKAIVNETTVQVELERSPM
jgi:hypothetical protein